MLLLCFFPVVLTTLFALLIFYLSRFSQKSHLKVIERNSEFAETYGMKYVPERQCPRELLQGFNLMKWGFSKWVTDQFLFPLGDTKVIIGDFHNVYIGDDHGRTVTFFLVEDPRFDFSHHHFIDHRRFGASWFQKRPPWVSQLKQGTLQLLRTNRWEVETNGNRLLIYRINSTIASPEIKNRIDEIQVIVEDFRQLS